MRLVPKLPREVGTDVLRPYLLRDVSERIPAVLPGNFEVRQKCLVCRMYIRNGKYNYSLMLDQLVTDFIEKYQPEEIEGHKQRIVEYRRWTETKQYSSGIIAA